MSTALPTDTTYVKSYRYVRAAMVALLLCLGAAVFRQSQRQHPALLSSISAYYYTPAQTIFVSALVALGACMIALQGTTRLEDVLLNIGGMLAPVVAVVPTSRGVDYRKAVRACLEPGPSPTNVDCPTVRSLEAATHANVAVNMWALLVVGCVGLVAGLLLPGTPWRRRSRTHKIGFCVAVVLYLLGVAGFWWFREGFIDSAHWISASGLFVCIVAVAIVNTVRRRSEQGTRPAAPTGLMRKLPWAAGIVFDVRHRYSAIAAAMIVVGIVLGVLTLTHVVALFWLEAALIALFAVFWIVQTSERWNEFRRPEEGDPGDDPGGDDPGRDDDQRRRTAVTDPLTSSSTANAAAE